MEFVLAENLPAFDYLIRFLKSVEKFLFDRFKKLGLCQIFITFRFTY